MRQSSFELMRIILFFMVVSIHVASPYLSTHTLVGTVNWQVANLLDGGSRVAVDCFVLLTGYFVGSLKDPKPSRLISKALSPVAFYLLLYFPLYFLNSGGNLAGAICGGLADLAGRGVYLYHLWYVQVLIVVYLLAPYLNLLVQQLSPRQARNLIIVLLVVGSAIPTAVYMTGVDYYDLSLLNSRLLLFITLYLLGAHLRKNVRIGVPPAKAFGLFIAADCLVVALSCLYNSRYSPLIFFGKLRGVTLAYPFHGMTGAFYEFNNLLVIAASVMLLAAFSSIRFSSKLVNTVSSWSYGAYIVHVWWITVLGHLAAPLGPVFESARYPLMTVLFVASVAVLSLLTEGLRQTGIDIMRTMAAKTRGSAVKE